MSSRKSPLRDRLLSNSPDPIKSSILRESGMGWNSPPTGSISSATSSSSGSGSITSPLRIAKRDSPGRSRGADVARRTSSSFRHVRNNNLVSKSPFKSQIPTPSTPSRPPLIFPTRRVSGEKRPRPSSIHNQAETENDRPFALKRDRKQSKGFQGLMEKEPVTKSPFRIHQNPPEEPRPPVPRPVSMPIMPTSPQPDSLTSTSVPTDTRPSPGRSSLVSRRMHGPRLSGGPKRERRKTVTFDERCDVVEFDREDSEDEAMESDEDRYGFPEPEDAHGMEEEDPFFRGSSTSVQQAHEVPDSERINDDVMRDNDNSYESVQLSDPEPPSPAAPSLFDPDSSITGLVDQMFSSTGGNTVMESLSGASTPPRISDIPTDLETEDGVPFGRSHHVERFLQHHQEHSFINSPHHSPIQPPHFSPRDSPHNSLVQASPQQHGSPGQGLPFSVSPGGHSPRSLPATPPHHQSSLSSSTPPLGRSTHVERVLKAREEGRTAAGEDDIDKLPDSPSPMKKPSETVQMFNLEDGLIPRFELGKDVAENLQPTSNHDSEDPFDYPVSRGKLYDDELNTSKGDESMDPANLSIGNSEVSLSGLLRETLDVNNHPPNSDSEDEIAMSSSHSKSVSDLRSSLPGSHSTESLTLPPRVGSPLGGSPRYGSPLARGISPVSHSSPLQLASSGASPQAGPSGRPRITREDVKRRLLHRRSFGSPGPDDEDPTTVSSSRRSPAPSPTVGDVDVQIQDAETVKSPDVPHRSLEDKEKDRLSIMTTMTDISTETAIVQSAQKVNLDLSVGSLVEADNALWSTKNGLKVDLCRDSFAESFGGSSLSHGMGIINHRGDVKVGSVSSNESVAAGSVKMGDVDVDMDMKSALDRLMDDVAGAGATGCADDSMMTDEYDESYDNQSTESPPRPSQHYSDGLHVSQNSKTDNRDLSTSSDTSVPPPLPPKDNIKTREQLILEKRREARRLEEEMDAPLSRGKAQEFRNLGVGRPSRRRSLSTGDAEAMGGGAKKRGEALLDVKEVIDDDAPLADSIERELKKLVETPATKSKYQIREREGTIYASSSDERISHTTGAGDLNAGKAWRTVRRPSDMNEYSKQIKEYRSQQNPGKAYGKVFVKVLGVKGIHVPLPAQPTIITCTLNNGIHFVTTPECQLAQDCRIDQEFELIEHSKLEFTLTLKVRRDPHIITQYKSLSPTPPAPPAPQPVVVHPPSRSGMRSFFSSSPKKSSKDKIVVQPPAPVPAPPQRLPENLARYLKPDGTLARAFISFKDVATRCDTRLFETSYPLIGQRVEIGGKFSTLQVGELVLQMFRLPPLPGIPPEELPQSLEECVRGLRHLNWHKVTYFQGTLTQIGGDCSTWRRRQLRVIGANLVAFNDVTKKATATIDLKKALAVEDDQEGAQGGRRSRSTDDYDGLYGVERSFRLIFPQDHEIVFFADTDEEKARWLEILRALVGHIPPHPLWGELLWQRQEELLKRGHSTQPAQSGAQSPS